MGRRKATRGRRRAAQGRFVGGSGGSSAGAIVGITNFSASSYYATATAAGEAGVATGFGVATLFQLSTLAGFSGNAPMADRSLGATGWVQYSGSGDVLLLGLVNGSGGFVSSPSRKFLPSDIGKVFLHIGLHTGAGGFLRAYADRQEVGAGTAIVGYTPASTLHQLAKSPQFAGVATPVTILAHVGFRGVPSLAQLQDYCDAARTLGDLPGTMTGATVTHRWSARDELRTALANSPAGRRTYGARNFSAANYASSAAGGIRGNAAGFFAAFKMRLDRYTTAGEMIASCMDSGGTVGWYLQIITGGTGMRFVISPAGVTPTYTFNSSDAGRTFVCAVHYTGTVARFYINRVQLGADAAVAWVANAGQPFTIGQWTGAQSFPSGSVFEVMGGDVNPTLGQIQQVFDDFESTGSLVPFAGLQHRYVMGAAAGVPSPVLDTIGTDNLTVAGTLELAVDVAKAPPAPAQLTDRTTLAGADALLRAGTPAVRVFDPSIDGRRTLGAQGFSTSNYLECAGGLVGSASGDWISWLGTVNTLPGTFACLVGKRNTSPQSGYDLTINGANVYYEHAYNAGIVAASTPLTAAMLGQPKVFTGVFTGSVIRLYVDGVQTGSDVSCTPGYLASSLPFRVGLYGDTTFAASTVSWYGDAGGLGVPTLAQIQAHAVATLATGRMQSIPGLTTMLHDPTADIVASGVDAVPVQVLDRVGTDHLTKVGIAVVTDANSIRAVGPYSAADAWTTAIGTGIQGVNAGFHLVIDAWFTKVPTATETLAECANAGGTTGYSVTAQSASLRTLIYGVVAGNVYTLTGADLNKRTRITVNKTGTVAQFFVNGVQVGADQVAATYNANTNIAMMVGQLIGTQGFSSGYIESVVGGNVALSPANVATYNADLTQAPPTIAAVTLKRWVFEQDIAAVSGALPARSVERVSGGDDLVRIGSPLTLAQRTDRLWSYEMGPILYGASTFSAANYYSNAAGLAGSTAGFFVALLYMIRSQAVASNVRAAVSKRPDTGVEGWQVATSGTHSTVAITLATTGGNYSSPAGVISASDVGKLMLFTGVLDAASLKLRGYIKRAEVSTGTTITGSFVPSAVAMMLGRRAVDVLAADAGIDVYGFTCGDAIPSLAEIQALHDACMASEDIQDVPGKSSLTISLKRDVIANGGALPATLLDRVGTSNFSRVGAGPSIAPQYARAWGW